MDYPSKFVNGLSDILEPGECPAFVRTLDGEPLRGLRANRLKLDDNETAELFGRLKPVTWCPGGFYVPADDEELTRSAVSAAGLCYFQEPSAMTPAAVLPVEPGDTVLDLCAAPGGKSTQLGEKLKGEGILFSNDTKLNRLMPLIQNVEKHGITNCVVLNESPGRLLKSFPLYFDKILVDAPCSGEGMFRREGRRAVAAWEKYPPDDCAEIQRGILRCAADMLKPGGMMVYSTCTFNRIENEDQISDLLISRPEMSLVPIDCAAGGLSVSKILPGAARIFPHRQDGEGHFIALMRKRRTWAALPPPQATRENASKPDCSAFLEFAEFMGLTGFTAQRITRRADALYLTPEDLPPLDGLKALRTGLYLGDIRKGHFEPSQALAMSLLRRGVKRAVDFRLDSGETRMFLGGQSFPVDGGANISKGYVAVFAGGHPLGFAKIQDGRLKNGVN